MRAAVAFWLLLVAGHAAAQDNAPAIVVPPAPAIVVPPAPAIMVPPAPLITPAPAGQGPAAQIAPAIPSAQSPVPDNNADTGQPAVAANPAASWVAGKTARLGVLNKIDGSVSDVSIQVGEQAHVGDLQLSVLACMVRPPDEIPDAAVFVTAQSAADSSAPPLYRGWILRSAPGAAIVGDASETFRVIGCT